MTAGTLPCPPGRACCPLTCTLARLGLDRRVIGHGSLLKLQTPASRGAGAAAGCSNKRGAGANSLTATQECACRSVPWMTFSVCLVSRRWSGSAAGCWASWRSSGSSGHGPRSRRCAGDWRPSRASATAGPAQAAPEAGAAPGRSRRARHASRPPVRRCRAESAPSRSSRRTTAAAPAARPGGAAHPALGPLAGGGGAAAVRRVPDPLRRRERAARPGRPLRRRRRCSGAALLAGAEWLRRRPLAGGGARRPGRRRHRGAVRRRLRRRRAVCAGAAGGRLRAAGGGGERRAAGLAALRPVGRRGRRRRRLRHAGAGRDRRPLAARPVRLSAGGHRRRAGGGALCRLDLARLGGHRPRAPPGWCWSRPACRSPMPGRRRCSCRPPPRCNLAAAAAAGARPSGRPAAELGARSACSAWPGCCWKPPRTPAPRRARACCCCRRWRCGRAGPSRGWTGCPGSPRCCSWPPCCSGRCRTGSRPARRSPSRAWCRRCCPAPGRPR